MNSKLTLVVSESVAKNAKRFAKKEKRSLSKIVENYLRILTEEDSKIENDGSISIIDSLRGAFELPENFDYRNELDKRLDQKYLK